MGLEIQTGEAVADGLYVCYVDNPALPAFTERKMLMRFRNEWCYPMSDQKYRCYVYGWIGPLPVLRVEHFKATVPVPGDELQEYDL